MEVIDGTYSPLRVAHSSELKRGADGATAQHQVERGELAVVAIEDEEGADRQGLLSKRQRRSHR